MTSRVRTAVLMVAAFLAGAFVSGGVGMAQTPCPEPTPVVVAPASLTGTAAIDWFKAQGVDQNESISPGGWGAFNPVGGHFAEADVSSWPETDELYGITVLERGGESFSDLGLVIRTMDHFLPSAGQWLRTALASAAPGDELQEAFGGVDVSLTMFKTVEVLSVLLTITVG